MNFSKLLMIPVLVLLGAVLFMSCYPQNQAETKAELTEAALASIQWHSVEDLAELQKDKSKKIMIDVYTDWCKWCKVMDQKTFGDPAMIPFLQENYHMVKFNAEHKTPIQFNGQTFDYKEGGRRGYNELANKLLGGKLSFPSVVVLNENLNIISVQKGFKDPTALKAGLAGI